MPPDLDQPTIPAYLSADCQTIRLQCSRCGRTYVDAAANMLTKSDVLRLDHCDQTGCPYKSMPTRLQPEPS